MCGVLSISTPTIARWAKSSVTESLSSRPLASTCKKKKKWPLPFRRIFFSPCSVFTYCFYNFLRICFSIVYCKLLCLEWWVIRRRNGICSRQRQILDMSITVALEGSQAFHRCVFNSGHWESIKRPCAILWHLWNPCFQLHDKLHDRLIPLP